jgi:hypothetical protein
MIERLTLGICGNLQNLIEKARLEAEEIDPVLHRCLSGMRRDLWAEIPE